ncbi:alpha/beta fold hydrolase [Halobium salinum]|uniref:Alpha/beta fold hydrolase n=1 Tax=Halobium salinum TaxID=1364940 RepID=A0ABD5PC50_9EURY|nr:alpha/beta hydrolase [Halobium salinum]
MNASVTAYDFGDTFLPDGDGRFTDADSRLPDGSAPADDTLHADDALHAVTRADATTRTATDADGRRVAYAEYGDPDGTPLLFLHGTPGSRLLGALYDRTARRRGVRVLAPDRPGYGASTPWPTRSLVDAGAFLVPVLDDAGVDRARVVGFSGGGPHALAFAATHGGRVTTVDAVGGAVPPAVQSTTPTVQRLLGTMASRTPRLLGAMLRGQRWVVERTDASAVVSQYTSADGDPVPEPVAELVGRDFVEALARSRSGVVVESRLHAAEWGSDLDRVSAPVRLWHGDRDTNVPVGGARRLADRLPDGRLTVLDGADHLGSLLRSRAHVLDRDGDQPSDSTGTGDG